LIRKGWVTWENLDKALAIQKESGRIIGEVLVENGFCTKRNLYQALAIQYKKVYVDFSKINVQPKVLELVPKRIAHELKVMPLVEKNQELLVAISDPKDAGVEAPLQKALPNYHIATALATSEDIQQAIQKYYGLE